MNAVGPVIALDHPAALDAGWVGTVAAELARGRATGRPVRPGVVLTRDWTWSPADRAIAQHAWRILSEDGRHHLTVRPSPLAAAAAAAGTDATDPADRSDRTDAEATDRADGADRADHDGDPLVAADEREFFAALAAVRGPAVEIGTPAPGWAGRPDVAVLLQPLPRPAPPRLLAGTAA